MDKTISSKQEDFGRRMVEILNCGALNLALAFGYKHGIFDVMEGLKGPSSYEEIAKTAGLSPRYVKEWLGVMVTGRVVELSTAINDESLYILPHAHATYLTRETKGVNLGVYTQEIPLLTSAVMDTVSDSFISGDGVPFSRYPEFQSFMADLSNAKHNEVLVDKFIPSVNKGLIKKRLEQGIRVCDIGCGEGVAMNLLAKAFPNSSFTGMDNFSDAIVKGAADALRLGLDNARYLTIDAAVLKDKPKFYGSFDYVMAFDSIHDQTEPLSALQGVRAILAEGGVFSMVDIDAASDHAGNMDHPMGAFLYTVSLMHCMPVGLNNSGAGLGMMWGKKRAIDMLHMAGFKNVEAKSMAHDPFNLHYLCR